MAFALVLGTQTVTLSRPSAFNRPALTHPAFTYKVTIAGAFDAVARPPVPAMEP